MLALKDRLQLRNQLISLWFVKELKALMWELEARLLLEQMLRLQQKNR